MCGLIASTGNINTDRLIALGCLSEARGRDSAGVGWIKRDGTPSYLKIAQNPIVAYPVTLRGSIRSAVRHGSPVIGHTRQATTGAVTSENAHPFLDEGILFAHNGIIWNYNKFGKYDVDSQSLIHGIKDRNFSEYEGPIALVWIEGGKLHAFRKGNPLYRGTRKKGVYLASSETYLKEVGCIRIRPLAEAHVYQWKGSVLEQTKVVPVNKTTYVKNFRGCETRAWDSDGYQSYGSYKDGREWDQTQMRFVDKKTSILVPEPKSEADTLAEVDAEEQGDSDLCKECKLEKRMIASDYCLNCVRLHFHMGGY